MKASVRIVQVSYQGRTQSCGDVYMFVACGVVFVACGVVFIACGVVFVVCGVVFVVCGVVFVAIGFRFLELCRYYSQVYSFGTHIYIMSYTYLLDVCICRGDPSFYQHQKGS